MLEDLTDSLIESGQVVPLLVRPFNKGYQIISGHRRRAALERAGFLEAECDIAEMDDEKADALLLTTNFLSQTLSEIEEAEGIQHMRDAYGWTQERVAKEFGKTKMWVSYRLSLLGLNDEVKESVNARLLTATHAREIAQLPQEMQSDVARQVIEEQLSTRGTNELVKQIKEPESTEEYVPAQNEPVSEEDITRVINKPEASLSKPREIPKRIKASDYITKFYEFLANLDFDTIDGFIELDEDQHVLAMIDSAKEQLEWMRSKIQGAKNGDGKVVEFRKKEAGN